ncbi:Hypothetical protein I595_2766 [Croceitalea dokdonensis DOKDO 023]|uniref:Uncharacterized protein n=1 Tax=Croceitalea dokdonensis DOKDO 023 TaxID=1300341 RepID=A0A0P7AYM7_9FLAO|nr:Hypothetical protein I595_2766 [Croceitalea dokdonensis DOKDO 023]
MEGIKRCLNLLHHATVGFKNDELPFFLDSRASCRGQNLLNTKRYGRAMVYKKGLNIGDTCCM